MNPLERDPLSLKRLPVRAPGDWNASIAAGQQREERQT